jgi:hypothetical protein
VNDTVEARSNTSAPRARRWPRIVLAALVVIALAVAWAINQLPHWARDKASTELSKLLDRPVSMASVDFGLWPLRAEVKDFKILEKQGSDATFAVASLSTELDWASVKQQYPIVKSVKVLNPKLSLVKISADKTNVDDLIDKYNNRPKSEGLPKFSVANIEIDGGAVHAEDRTVKSKHSLTALQAKIPFISSLPIDQKVWIKPELSFKLDDRLVKAQAESLPFDGTYTSRLNLRIEPFELAPWLVYWPKTAVVAPIKALLEASVNIDFSQEAKTKLVIKGSLKINDAQVRQALRTSVFENMDIQVQAIAIGAFELQPIEKKFRAQSIEVEQPSIQLVRPTNVVVATKQADNVEAPVTFDWELGEVRINQGAVSYQDPGFLPRPLKVHLAQVSGVIGGLSSNVAQVVVVKANAKADKGEAIEIDSKFSKVDDDNALNWRVDNASLSDWWWFVEPYLISTPKGGKFQSQGRVLFGPKAGVRLDQLSLKVADFSLKAKSGLEWAKFSSLTISDFSLGVDARSIKLGKIDVSKFTLLTKRGEQGQLSILEVLPKPAKPAAAVASADTVGATNVNKSSKTNKENNWTIDLQDVRFEKSVFEMFDEVKDRDTEIRAENVSLLAKNLSIDTGASFTTVASGTAIKGKAGSVDISGSINQKGRVKLKGPLQLQPLSSTLELDFADINLLPFQAYFTEFVNASINRGDVALKGKLALNLASENPVQYQGSVAVNQFASVTKQGNEDLLRWKALRLNNTQLVTKPFSLDLGDIEIDDFYSRLILSAEGRLNLQDLAATKEALSSEVKPEVRSENKVDTPTERVPVRIGKITLNNGNVNFSDFFVKPNYTANMTNLSGSVTELTPEKVGQVNLSGRVDGTGSLAIEGSINPLIRNLFIDIKADATDIDLPRLSPYSGKYIGYGIEKGKLSAKLAYKLENRKLQAENRVVLDQLTFGEKVDSPTAMKLPILFAVALLKDRNGVIDINMPVGGSLDDPQFSISGLVFRMIGNLIVKVITSPFTLLASLGGGKDQELSKIDFAVGSATLTKASIEKAESIAKALSDRPALKLDLSGRANPQEDTDALKKVAFDRLLKAQKLRETLKGNVGADAIDSVEILPAEYPKYLALAFKATQKGFTLFQRATPVPEMEKALNEQAKVSDADVLNLANRRAQAMKDWLAETGKIAPERLFITAPKLEGAARVELGLK